MEMGVLQAGSVTAMNPNIINSPDRRSDGTADQNFLNYLHEALNQVNSYQQEATQSAANLAIGNNQYLHDTTIAYEKAILALQLTVEIRNKLVSAYEEIMRMQL